MAFSRSFAAGLIVRTLVLAAAVGLLVAAILLPGLAVARLLAAALAGAALWGLWRYVDRTNREVARFVDAIRHRDFAQAFDTRAGSGFDRLGQAFEQSLRELREERIQAGEDGRMLAALVEEAPSALLLVEADGRVRLVNRAARNMIRLEQGTRIADFAVYGGDLVRLLGERQAVPRRMIALVLGGVAQRAVASLSLIAQGGHQMAAVALQPIQQELSEVELAAQSDLVRVLTHEIMNSITPVVSLAETAVGLMAGIEDRGDRAIEDARLAVATLARRAGGIMHFVEAYRSFARPPVIHRARIDVHGWLDDLLRAFRASPAGARASVSAELESADMILDGDGDLLGQVVLNLLKNAVEAARDDTMPTVRIDIARLTGDRLRIAVDDDGPGIEPGREAEIFLPFFTSKPSGTGVGLSLARRIVAAHGGTITASRSALGGARFEIVI